MPVFFAYLILGDSNRILKGLRINYYQEGKQVYPHLDAIAAYKKALQTWATWVNRHINPHKTQVLFRSTAPAHFSFFHSLTYALLFLNLDVYIFLAPTPLNFGTYFLSHPLITCPCNFYHFNLLPKYLCKPLKLHIIFDGGSITLMFSSPFWLYCIVLFGVFVKCNIIVRLSTLLLLCFKL